MERPSSPPTLQRIARSTGLPPSRGSPDGFSGRFTGEDGLRFQSFSYLILTVKRWVSHDRVPAPLRRPPKRGRARQSKETEL